MNLEESRKLLSHPVYGTKAKPRGYNVPVTVVGACSARDGANLLMRFNPQWTREDHTKLARAHEEAARLRQEFWDHEAESAAMDAFGRPYRITDYQISGIACDLFTESHKVALRDHLHSASKHRVLAVCHQAAATTRKALQ